MSVNVKDLVFHLASCEVPIVSFPSPMELKTAILSHFAILSCFDSLKPREALYAEQQQSFIAICVNISIYTALNEQTSLPWNLFGAYKDSVYSALNQTVFSHPENGSLEKLTPWQLSSISMSVACCALYHLVDDEQRAILFQDQKGQASLTDAGKMLFLHTSKLIAFYENVAPWSLLRSDSPQTQADAYSEPEMKEPVIRQAGCSEPALAICRPAESLPNFPSETAASTQQVLPPPSGHSNLVGQPVWPENEKLADLLAAFEQHHLAPKTKAKLLPVAITIYLHALGLCLQNTVADLRLSLANVAASGQPLRKAVVKLSELYGTLANAGRLRSLKLPPANSLSLAKARKRAGKTVKLNNQQELERETRWIGWHAFLATQMFAAGPLPLPEWDTN